MTCPSRQIARPRIALIGCGAIAELYHLPALVVDPALRNELILVDSNAARRQAMADRFGVSRTLGNFESLDGLVDGVVIATPPATHFRIAQYFLDQSVPVLCEKPLTESVREARELCDLADRNQVGLAVNQTRRLFPTYGRIRELIRDGVLGELRSITYHDGFEFDWPAASPFHFQPGAKGALSDTGIHLLDTICWWLDASPELVESWADAAGGPEAMATLRLRHGSCDVELKVSRLGRLPNQFRIEGTRGWIEAGNEDWSSVSVHFRDGNRQFVRIHRAPAKYHEFAIPLVSNFRDVITKDAAPLISGRSTLPAIDLLEQAYARARPYAAPWDAASRETVRITGGSMPDAPCRVFVTGASGFVGGRIVEIMRSAGTYEPVAAIRGWTRAARVARQPVRIVPCDILDPAQVRSAIRSVDAIVHCASMDDRRSIVEGTRHLLEAAAEAGISKFVFLSTAEVYGPRAFGEISEDAPRIP
ncbi:MAG TPA: Gfo/Idh/MocA family oxidoreductase, partial [Pirellulaceae bacterium]